jgi:hypothetical protein
LWNNGQGPGSREQGAKEMFLLFLIVSVVPIVSIVSVVTRPEICLQIFIYTAFTFLHSYLSLRAFNLRRIQQFTSFLPFQMRLWLIHHLTPGGAIPKYFPGIK